MYYGNVKQNNLYNSSGPHDIAQLISTRVVAHMREPLAHLQQAVGFWLVEHRKASVVFDRIPIRATTYSVIHFSRWHID